MRRAPVPEMDWVTAICKKEAKHEFQIYTKEECAYRIVLQGSTVSTVGKESGTLSEFGQTSDWEILLVGVRVRNELLCLLDRVEDVWLAIVVAVSTNTKIDLAWILVGFECLSHT